MAHLLFRLRYVTDEEAMEVRTLLADQGFDTYETQAGFFRLGVDAIWLRDESQRNAAETALAAYQAARFDQAQHELHEARAQGKLPTLWQRLVEHPVQVILVLVAVGLIGALTLLPFLGLMRG
ncbi:DUF6164 family protein [Vreelandella populi]|uniref:DUF2007 domain-containing protein n=1 Tax=Vreelandella populi TaxID=2498858 RepID=A0A433L9G8_9GAMM|nr:DUF6164 family protein [Halomonas populi]RUR41289.1 hypothetical protein ELY25_02420 [Halomonas populi]RUR44306.1 hypothetical protein ELY37_14505 [Halomonas populi]RUR56298.1 hypothetical protein ELY40_03835 [Halomonas populi]